MVGELRVCIDLLSKGFEIFHAVSPNCSCDLAVLKDGKLIKIEIRTGYRTRNGTLQWGKNKFRADMWAIVLKDEIIYVPEL